MLHAWASHSCEGTLKAMHVTSALLVTAMQVQYIKSSLQVTCPLKSRKLDCNLLSGVMVARKTSFSSWRKLPVSGIKLIWAVTQDWRISIHWMGFLLSIRIELKSVNVIKRFWKCGKIISHLTIQPHGEARVDWANGWFPASRSCY